MGFTLRWRLVAARHRRLHSFPTAFRPTSGLGEGFMGLKAIGAVLLASGVAFAVVTADAATTKRKPARVVVTKRSYLDAGTEVKPGEDRKSTRLNSSHMSISYAVFCSKQQL